MVEIPSIPFKISNKIRSITKIYWTKKFYKNLLKIDPLIINHFNPTDAQRSIRAYEVKLFTKKSITEWHKSTKSSFKKKEFL